MNWQIMQFKRLNDTQTSSQTRNLLQSYFLPNAASVVLVICGLSILLSGCTSPINLFPTPSKSGNGVVPTFTPNNSTTKNVSSTPTPKPVAITLQVASNCPSNMNWDSLVGTHANVNKVQKVTCDAMEGNGALQA